MSLIDKAVGQICQNYRRRPAHETAPNYTQEIVEYVHMAPPRIDALLAEFERRGHMEVIDFDVHIGDFFHEGSFHHVDLMVNHFKQFLVARLLDPLVADALGKEAWLTAGSQKADLSAGLARVGNATVFPGQIS